MINVRAHPRFFDKVRLFNIAKCVFSNAVSHRTRHPRAFYLSSDGLVYEIGVLHRSEITSSNLVSIIINENYPNEYTEIYSDSPPRSFEYEPIL
jgi:hypothetical protein